MDNLLKSCFYIIRYKDIRNTGLFTCQQIWIYSLIIINNNDISRLYNNTNNNFFQLNKKKRNLTKKEINKYSFQLIFQSHLQNNSIAIPKNFVPRRIWNLKLSLQEFPTSISYTRTAETFDRKRDSPTPRWKLNINRVVRYFIGS